MSFAWLLQRLETLLKQAHAELEAERQTGISVAELALERQRDRCG
jgi:hypothetical protein